MENDEKVFYIQSKESATLQINILLWLIVYSPDSCKEFDSFEPVAGARGTKLDIKGILIVN